MTLSVAEVLLVVSGRWSLLETAKTSQRQRHKFGVEKSNATEQTTTRFVFYSSGIENNHEVYSIAQLEARPSLTKETSCGDEHRQQSLIPEQQFSNINNKRGQQQSMSRGGVVELSSKKNSSNSACVGQEQQEPKVQKNAPKSVRICEPKRSESRPRNNYPSSVALSTFATRPETTGVPLHFSGFSSCTATNRPRSVTDALFAAAPELVAVPNNCATEPTEIVEPPLVDQEVLTTEPAVCITEVTSNDLLPPSSAEDMNEGFLQFADADQDLISEYRLHGDLHGGGCAVQNNKALAVLCI